MEHTIKTKILNSIERIYEESKGCKLDESFFSEIDTELYVLSKYFRTTKSQSFLIAMVYALNYKDETVDFNNLAEHFDSYPIKILEYSDDFKYLHLSSIFRMQKSQHRVKVAGANDQYVINEKITKAILENESMPKILETKTTDIYELLEKIYIIGAQRDVEKITTSEIFNLSKELISNNLHFSLIKEIVQLKIPIEDSYFFLCLIWKAISFCKSTEISWVLENIYDIEAKRDNYKAKIISGENILVEKDLIEIIKVQWSNGTILSLTDNSYNLLKECGINLLLDKNKKSA